MSAAVSSSPANQDRPLLLPSPLPSDQRTSGRRMWTLLDLLTVEKLDGQDPRSIIRSDDEEPREVSSRWRILRERLGCCGVATWRYGNEDEDEIDIVEEITEETDVSTRHRSSGINLAAALAAEREYRTATEEIISGGGGDGGGGGNTTPSRVSLMRLLEETADGGELERESKGEGGEKVDEEVVEGSDNDSVCCVCMGRNKGAAFIPCGHTYCRVCSRELWLSRGSCPLCNQRILDILDIF